MARTRTDIDELISLMVEMKRDGYVTAELEIIEEDDESNNELSVSAVEIESENPVHYSNIAYVKESI